MTKKKLNAKSKSTVKSTTSFTVGIDLGGTKMAAALVDNKGQIVDQFKVPVEMAKEGQARKTQKRILTMMGDLTTDFSRRYPAEWKRLKGVGLASAGPLNVEKGALINPVNFPGWKIVPIRDLLSQELQNRGIKTSVSFQNDAIAASLAEGWIGGAQGHSSYALVTVGTGIGSGVINQGRPCQNQGMGSEFGHLIADLEGLKQGKARGHCSVEGIASGTGLLRRARELGFKGHSVEELVEQYEKGDLKYQMLFDDMALALAIIYYDLSIGFNLSGIWLSGGLIKIKHLWLKQSLAHYSKLINDFNPAFKSKIAISKSGNQAGVIGAARLPYL